MKPKICFISTVPGLPSDCLPYRSKLKKPYWLKSKDVNTNTIGTIKRCPGIIDYLSQGFVVPLWSDLVISYDSSTMLLEVSFLSEWARCSLHTKEQFLESPIEKYAYPYAKIIKLEVPWRIELSKGYSSLLVDPIYHDKHQSLSALPGMVDHDSFHVANVFMSFSLYGKGKCIVKRGTPIYQIIPIKRAEFNMSIRHETIIDKEKSAREENLIRSLTKNYWKAFWKAK